MQKQIWLRKVPLIRILLPFIFGILLQFKFNFELRYFFELIVFTAVLIISSFLFKKIYESYNFRWLQGFLVYIFLFCLGLYITKLNQVELPEIDFNEKLTLTARITESPEEKEKSVKAIVEYISIEDSIEWKKLSGKALIYFAKDSLSQLLKFGDVIVFNASISEIKNSGNPYEFNYKKYLGNQKVLTQAYLASGSWCKLKNSKQNYFMYQANSIRNYLLKIYKKFDFAEKEYAVLSALTLGYKADFDDQTIQAYSATGAMHILSVSGLHVGVIYLILNFVLGFMDKKKKTKYLKIGIIIFFLWLFAYISGLSPSVRRAAIMFSLILSSELLNREKNIYNIIATSIFLMLIFNPFVIRDVGFQLSYIAVLSIIFFQPKIYKTIYVKNKFLDKIWALLTVSIAAQLGTMPLGFFYFHQFPNYFFLTNIIAVPLSSFILYAAVGLLAVSFYNPLANVVAFILNYLLKALNFTIDFIDKLPYSSTKDIFISSPQAILMYAIIFSITMFIIQKKKSFLYLTLSIILIYLLTDTIQEIKSLKQKSIIVYNVKNSCSVNFIDGNKNYLLSDTAVLNNDKTINYIFKNNWLNRSITDYKSINIDTIQNEESCNFFENSINSTEEFIQFYDKKILIMREKTLAENIGFKPLELDYIILSNNIYVSINDLTENFNVKKIIFDSSNKSWRIEKWKQECYDLNIEYFSVPDSGAFVLEL
jgi:competence protein ComEC